jgi:hypothetical protein
VLLSPVLVVFIWGLVCWTWSSNGGNHNGHEASSFSHSQSTQRKRKRQLHSSSAAATTATTTTTAAAIWQAQRPPNVQSLESDSPADWPPQLLDSTRNRFIVQPPLPLPLQSTTTNQVAAWPALQQQYYYTFPPQQQYAQQSAPKVSTNAVLPMPQANAAAPANAAPIVGSSSLSSSQQYYYLPNQQQAQQPQQQQQLYRATTLDSVVDVPPPPFVTSSALAARPKAASDGGGGGTPVRLDPPAVSSSSSQQQHYYYFPNPQQAQPPPPLAIENGAAAPLLLPLGPADRISDVAATPALGAALSPPLLHPYLRHGPINDHNVGHYNRHSGQRNAQQEHVRYFYYDPKAMRHSDQPDHGHWHLPHFVVDAVTGRKVSLQALSAVAPIVVQPPLNMIHFATLNATNGTNATLYNYTHTHPPVVNTRQKRTLSWPFVLLGNGTTNSNTAASPHRLALLNPNNTTASDKSLLVCTVGVMALLVGAVSARRLRHRSIVWSLCIDTDAAHDHDLYAAPPTATGAGTAASYHTFGGGGGGWRGDLEKFDV